MKNSRRFPFKILKISSKITEFSKSYHESYLKVIIHSIEKALYVGLM
ncbi:hypothetical protein D922_02541 [Enterococcus faecalis 06-MB-DW-09]|nr:hypothetical protein D922_02541 [Enterococcus faecalis 06-MB-DW-09]